MRITHARTLRLPKAGRAVLLALAVALLTAGSVALHRFDRQAHQEMMNLGDSTAPDRLGIFVLVQKIDPASATVTAQILLLGGGPLMENRTHSLKQDITVVSNAVTNPIVTFKAGRNPEFATLEFSLFDGALTDYPFDSYKMPFVLYAFTGAEKRTLPIHVVFNNIDAFLQLTPHQRQTIRLPRGLEDVGTITPPEGTFIAEMTVERSRSTLVFAVFIMVFMWSLTIAALIAAWHVGSGRLGLFWSGLGFLGTLLFALIPLRNAVPGNPPIGSLIDFAAFFIAECVVSISMIVTVLHGYLVEAKKKLAEPDEE